MNIASGLPKSPIIVVVSDLTSSVKQRGTARSDIISVVETRDWLSAGKSTDVQNKIR